jgi:phosphatidylglycerol:prolipoprotein diacylglycerol transferase
MGGRDGNRLTLDPHLAAWQRDSVNFLAYYMDRLDPVIFKLNDKIQLRWYGVAYVLGFIAGYYLLLRWAKRGVGVLKESQVADFLTYAALFGVLLGGRLGYMLFYDFEKLRAEPLSFFRVWDGGMASHGGILGLFFFTLYWSVRHKQSWTGLGDNLVVAAPLGLFFGRIANFINGELYGRATTVSWAMKFPEEAAHMPADHPNFQAVSRLVDSYEIPLEQEAVKHLARTSDEFAQKLEPLLTPRHPSQLYEGFLEGLLLFGILFYVRERWPRAPHGLITGIFFVVYACFRIAVENYREPDKNIQQPDYIIPGLTQGQLLSYPMILMGIAFLVYSYFQSRKRPAEAGS